MPVWGPFYCSGRRRRQYSDGGRCIRTLSESLPHHGPPHGRPAGATLGSLGRKMVAGHYLTAKSLNARMGNLNSWRLVPRLRHPQWRVNRPFPVSAAMPRTSSHALWTQRTYGRSARAIPFAIPHVETPAPTPAPQESPGVLGCNGSPSTRQGVRHSEGFATKNDILRVPCEGSWYIIMTRNKSGRGGPGWARIKGFLG